jgi:hypothetical protein
MDNFSIIIIKPISDDMLYSWMNPDPTNLTNCVPCVALFFGFIDQQTFDHFNELTRNRGMSEVDVNNLFSNLITDNLTSITCVHYVPDLYDIMPSNNGIMLFIRREDDSQHACILAKTSNNEIVMIDPQIQQAVIGRDNVNTYFQNDKVVRACVLSAKLETGTHQKKRSRLTGGNKKTKHNKKQQKTKHNKKQKTKHNKKQKTKRNKKYRHCKK